ncbi:MAG: FAD-dependent oxidoreductase [Cohaesibacter sp.]|nr:FAD-dependent oxidoreductase [Cohaesibacter sp.]
MDRIVIIGAGQAGFSAASGLRKQGFKGEIDLIGDELHLPYQRPPLSKKYLLGEMSADRLTFRDQAFFDQEKITLHLGKSVTALDRAEKCLSLDDGQRLSYDRLILTTGSRARALPDSLGAMIEPERLFTIRNLADIDRMQQRFQAGAHLLVLGGGYIGLEAAAVARQMGLTVTLVEMQERLLARVTSPQTSDYFANLHKAQGVDLRLGVALIGLEQNEDGLIATLGNEESLNCDLVVAGIGGLANCELAQQAGLSVSDGIVVDDYGRTSDEAIFAAGDCCQLPYQGRSLRLESVQNAIDQATMVAKTIMGGTEPYCPSPWFWSDQYDVKLQIAGLFDGYDLLVTRPGKDERSCSHWYYRKGGLICVESINDPRAYMMGKRWLEKGQSPNPDSIANPDKDLKQIAV